MKAILSSFTISVIILLIALYPTSVYTADNATKQASSTPLTKPSDNQSSATKKSPMQTPTSPQTVALAQQPDNHSTKQPAILPPTPPMTTPATNPQPALAPTAPASASPHTPATAPIAPTASTTTVIKPTQPPPKPASLIQMNFDNIELRDLIRFVSNIIGKNFIFDENFVKGKITILAPQSISKDDVLRVFEAVLNYQGLNVVVTNEAIKIVRGAEAKGMAIETVDKEKLENMPPEDKLVSYIHPLAYLDSNTMVGILRPLMSKDAYLVSIAATNSLIMIDTASNIQRIKKLLLAIDIPTSKQLSNIKIYNVQHTNAVELAKVLQQLMAEGKKPQTPKEKIFITAYAATNSLMISAPAEDIGEIERIIKEIDTWRPQVLVEAAIVETSISKSYEFGLEWFAGAKHDTNLMLGGMVNKTGSIVSAAAAAAKATAGDLSGIASAVSPGLNIAVVGDYIKYKGVTYPTLGAFVKALSSDSDVNILSTPQILTINNEEAEIIVGENIPYQTSTRLDAAGQPINQYDYRDVGIKLKVKPIINKDGFVYLNIYQEVSKVATTGGATDRPSTLKRSTKTTVGVRDSQTIMISGLIKDDSTKAEDGIPLLRSIPILGALFGYEKRTNDKTNLMIFLTPRIIYTPEQIEQLTRAKQEEIGTRLPETLLRQLQKDNEAKTSKE